MSSSEESYKITYIGQDGKRKKAENHVYAEEDEVLFGDANVRIHQHLSERIEAGLVEGVASLPLMGKQDETSRDEKMIQKLRKAYLKNVDLLELHNSRNVFTVGRHTPHFRKRILEAHLAQQKGDDLLARKLEEIRNSRVHSNNDNTHSKLPTKEEIPSQEDMVQLEEELKTLRNKLETSRKIRAKKLAQCKSLKEAAAFSKQAQETLDQVPAVAKVPKKIESVVAAKKEQALLKGQGNQLIHKMEQALLKGQGNQLIHKMDDIKKERENENNDKIPSPELKKPRKLTLEEHYAEHCTILGESQPKDLFALRDMFKPKP